MVSAGTADEGVAEECRLIADFMGCYTFRLPDVSVDGLHRILHNLPGRLVGAAQSASLTALFRLLQASYATPLLAASKSTDWNVV